MGISQSDRLAQAAALVAYRDRSLEAADLLTWTLVHRRWLKPGMAFDLSQHPYLTEIYGSNAKDMVIFKAAQMGASEYAISYAMHMCDQREGNVLYLFPTSGAISDFSSARIGTALDASDHLNSIVGDESEHGGARRKSDRVHLKRIKNRFLYLRGTFVNIAGQAPQLKSIDADAVVFDEYDEMDERVDPIASKRLGHSVIAERRYISTPTYPQMGIHRKFLGTDQREWFVTCDHCGNWQNMTLDDVVRDWNELNWPVDWWGKEEGTAWVACRKCKRPLDRTGAGEWVATGKAGGAVGYHLSRVFSPHSDLYEMVRSLQTADETERKEAINQDWGEPYSPKGSGLTMEDYEGAKRDYMSGVVEGERCVAGIDVGSILTVVIRGEVDSERGDRPLRWAGNLATFAEAKDLLVTYNVKRCVIDLRPEVRKVRELMGWFPAHRVWGASFKDIDKSSPVEYDLDQGIVKIDRTRVMDSVVAGFKMGVLTLPADIDRIAPTYAKELTAPIRVVEKKGAARYVTEKADHFAFAELYCVVAATPHVIIAPGYLKMTSVKGW